MQTLRVEINDTIVDKVLYFLNNLPQSDVKLSIENSEKMKTPRKLSSISLKTKGFKFNRDDANER